LARGRLPRSWLAVAFSAGGDGGRKSPETFPRNLHTSFAAASATPMRLL
jgi:hypothetical protein